MGQPTSTLKTNIANSNNNPSRRPLSEQKYHSQNKENSYVNYNNPNEKNLTDISPIKKTPLQSKPFINETNSLKENRLIVVKSNL